MKELKFWIDLKIWTNLFIILSRNLLRMDIAPLLCVFVYVCVSISAF